MTEQEVFDKVAKHLLAQNARSVTSFDDWDESIGCAYRGENNMQCAVGCLIPDELYRSDMEGLGAGELLTRFPDLLPDASVSLLYELQTVHDSYEPKKWREKLRRVARAHNLSAEAVDG